jgi:hypothetical protein
MKKTLLVIGALVISISIIGWVYYKMNTPSIVYKDTIVQQVEYKNAVDSNKKLLADKDSAIAVLTDSIIVLNEMVTTQNNILKTLKTKRNEKNNNIAKFSTLDLSKFLSDFYKDSVK